MADLKPHLVAAAVAPPRAAKPDPGLPNLIVLHGGMGWPRGAVVPKAAFAHGYHEHLLLGAVAETAREPTVEVSPEVLRPPTPAPAAGEPAVARIAELDQKVAALRQRVAELEAVNASLRTELAAATDLLDPPAPEPDQLPVRSAPWTNASNAECGTRNAE